MADDLRFELNFDLLVFLFLLSLYMEKTQWKPTSEDREVMEAVWIQIKGACEKLKEETNAKNEHIRNMLQEMADLYYS